MFVTAGARSNFLLEREISLQFQLQTLASAQYRVQATLDKVYNVGDLDPNNPNLIASHERLVQQLFEWQKRINSTQMRLNMELQMVQAEKPKQDEMFKNGVKKFYDMMA
ncbi:MAG: hypothetical protein ACK551_03645 [Vampirovibrionales bacterium]|jgi:hypothetical protein